jgi:hypothetical protein
MTSQPRATAGQPELDAARLMLARMGISPTNLIHGATNRAPAPTFAAYVPIVSNAVSGPSRRAYSSYWKKIVEHWGGRRLDEQTASEVKQLAEHIRISAGSSAGTAAVDGARSRTSSPPFAVFTTTQSTTATSPPPRTPLAKSTSHAGLRAHAVPSPMPDSPKSTRSLPPPATTPLSTRYCCACTPRPPAAAAEPWQFARSTSTPTNA